MKLLIYYQILQYNIHIMKHFFFFFFFFWRVNKKSSGIVFLASKLSRICTICVVRGKFTLSERTKVEQTCNYDTTINYHQLFLEKTILLINFIFFIIWNSISNPIHLTNIIAKGETYRKILQHESISQNEFG